MSVCLSCSILCSSSRPPFNVRNFLANCSASCLVSVRSVSSSRFSLCMDSSDRAVTFSSISSSMFCSTRRREAISNMMTAKDPPDAQGARPVLNPLHLQLFQATGQGALSLCCHPWPTFPALLPVQHITTNPPCSTLCSICAHA